MRPGGGLLGERAGPLLGAVEGLAWLERVRVEDTVGGVWE